MLFGSLGHRTNAGILCALVLLAFPRLVLSEAPLASGLLREVAELGVLASDSSVTSHARERERDSVTMCGHCLGGIIGRLCLETVQLLLCCIAAHLHCCPFFSGRFGGAKCVFLIPDTPWDCHIYICLSMDPPGTTQCRYRSHTCRVFESYKTLRARTNR